MKVLGIIVICLLFAFGFVAAMVDATGLAIVNCVIGLLLVVIWANITNKAEPNKKATKSPSCKVKPAQEKASNIAKEEDWESLVIKSQQSSAGTILESPEQIKTVARLSVEIDPEQKWQYLTPPYSLHASLQSEVQEENPDYEINGGCNSLPPCGAEVTLIIPLKEILSVPVKQDLDNELERIAKETNKAKGWQTGDSGYLANEPVVWVNSVEEWGFPDIFAYSAGICQRYQWNNDTFPDSLEGFIPFSTVEAGWRVLKLEICGNYKPKCKFIDEVDPSDLNLYKTEVFPKRIKSLIDVSYLQTLADKAIRKLIKNGLACLKEEDNEGYQNYVERILKFL